MKTSICTSIIKSGIYLNSVLTELVTGLTLILELLIMVVKSMVGLRFILIVWFAVWTLLTEAFSWKRLPWQHPRAQKPTGYIKLATQHPKFELTDVADKIISIIYLFLYSFKLLTKLLLIKGKYCSKFKICVYSIQYLSSCWRAI